MPISVDWNDKSKARIECRFQDPWSIEQFLDARKAWHRMIKSVDGQAPILLDLSNSFAVPKGALRHFLAMRRAHHPRQAGFFVLGLNPAYQKLAPFAFNADDTAGPPVRLVDSYEAVAPQP